VVLESYHSYNFCLFLNIFILYLSFVTSYCLLLFFQINIPEQSEEVEWLHFSPVEEHFYWRQHSECSQDFLNKLSKMPSLDITLDSLDRQTINKVNYFSD
jgi:hypothetical protein